MLPTTQDRTDDHTLWRALDSSGVRRAHRPPDAAPARPGALVVGGWLTFYVTVLAFQPDLSRG